MPELLWPVAVEYLPVPQSVHATLPVVVLYFPATQAIHEPPSGPVNPILQMQLESAALPLGELVSLGQTRHVVSSGAPVLVEYFPAPQLVHTALEVAPVLVKYLPAPQSVHTALEDAPVLVEYFPAPQSVHTALEVAPVLVEYFPAPQSVHATLPLIVLYLPAAHSVQMPSSGPVYPALHFMMSRQLLSAVLPAKDVLPRGHEVHAALPRTLLYVPAAHSVQGSNLYFWVAN